MTEWKKHGEYQGYNDCNKFIDATKKQEMQEEEKIKEHAKNELSRYVFYFERFVNHDKA
jgi:hypothetical protein